MNDEVEDHEARHTAWWNHAEGGGEEGERKKEREKEKKTRGATIDCGAHKFPWCLHTVAIGEGWVGARDKLPGVEFEILRVDTEK